MVLAERKINRVAMLIAMASEAQPLIDALSLDSAGVLVAGMPMLHYFGKMNVLGKMDCVEIDVITSGVDERFSVDNIGPVPATLMAMLVCQRLTPDLIISAGTAGGWARRGADIGTVYLSDERFVFHDRDVPLPGFAESGQGHYPALNVKALAVALNLPLGIISTGSSLRKNDRDMKVIEAYSAVAKEMEAAAIAWVCQLTQTPFLAVKAITNLLDQPDESELQFMENLTHSSKKLTQSLLEILRWLPGKRLLDLSG